MWYNPDKEKADRINKFLDKFMMVGTCLTFSIILIMGLIAYFPVAVNFVFSDCSLLGKLIIGIIVIGTISFIIQLLFALCGFVFSVLQLIIYFIIRCYYYFTDKEMYEYFK